MNAPRLLLPALALATGLACGRQPHWPDDRPDAACEARTWPQEPIVVDVKRPDRTRRAVAWTPPTDGPWDVVLNLHEFRADPVRQQHYSTWLPFAQGHGILLLGPDGKSSTWNAGACCGKARDKQIDDVGFLDALVARMDATACTTGRVLATGIGNGGMMAQRWACESDVPDGVISVGGALQTTTCPQSRPIPLLHFHGAADTFIPADGSPGVVEGGLDGGRHVPVADALALWRARNGATGEGVTTRDGQLTCTRWSGKAPVVSCVIAQGADTWPGAANGLVQTASRLGNATEGGWAWMVDAWAALEAGKDLPEPTEPAEPEPAEPTASEPAEAE